MKNTEESFKRWYEHPDEEGAPSIPPLKFPKVIVFDCDNTLYDRSLYYMTPMGGALPWEPVRNTDDQSCKDRAGNRIDLFPPVRWAIEMIISTDEYARGDIKLALASRTPVGKHMQQMLSTLMLHKNTKENVAAGRKERVPLFDVFQQVEFYDIPKTNHFEALHRKLGGKIDYSDMMFFDDNKNEIDRVAPLGVHTVYTPDGFNDVNIFPDAIEKWQREKGLVVDEEKEVNSNDHDDLFTQSRKEAAERIERAGESMEDHDPFLASLIDDGNAAVAEQRQQEQQQQHSAAAGSAGVQKFSSSADLRSQRVSRSLHMQNDGNHHRHGTTRGVFASSLNINLVVAVMLMSVVPIMSMVVMMRRRKLFW